MPGGHIFPAADADFSTYTDDAVPYLTTNATRLGVSKDNNTLLTGLQGQWDDNQVKITDDTQRTPAVVATKNKLRQQIEKALRNVYADIPQSALTDDDRAVLHLKARDTHGTRVPPMNHAPVMTMGGMEHLQHTLRFQNSSTSDSKAMPERQKIYLEYFIGSAGLAPATIAFANGKNISKFKAAVVFTEADAGQTCYYRCCYENTHGERSPWSATLSAVIS
jgi:hypothetical protein